MELEKLAAQPGESDEALDKVALRIHPLPGDVEPSEEFLRRTRMQLLKLPRQQQGSQKQAA